MIYGVKVSPQPLCFDAPQGNNEARTEAYMKYVEGVLELLTLRSAKSASGASSLAAWQVGMSGGSW